METHFEGMEKALSEDPKERVANDLKALVRDAEALVSATAGDLSEKTKDARARLTAALEKAKATGRHLQEKSIATAKAADKVVREHPYESIGVAFGLGLLIGVLVTRK